jgi:hypothetical protein
MPTRGESTRQPPKKRGRAWRFAHVPDLKTRSSESIPTRAGAIRWCHMARLLRGLALHILHPADRPLNTLLQVFKVHARTHRDLRLPLLI